MRSIASTALLLLLAWCPFAAAQLPPSPYQDPLSAPAPPDPFTTPGLSPQVAFLFSLDTKFSRDTAQGGGAAFAKWFAPDAVMLSNGKAPVMGSAAIATAANWTAAQYQLTWTPEGGRMSPAGDMGFTWGTYQGRAKDRDGTPILTSGRYMTIWKKQPDGSWKVEMDASNEAPKNKADCCKLP